MDDDRVIEFVDEDGVTNYFYIIEKATIAGKGYYLVTDNKDFFEAEEELEVDCMILKETQEDDDSITCEILENEAEITAISKVFDEMLDDENIEIDDSEW